jgi:predicted RNase H-like HicB family nuclease
MRRTFTAVVERDTDTDFYVGFVPGMPGAHTQAESLDELNANLKEVVEMLLEDGVNRPRPRRRGRRRPTERRGC